MTLMVIRSTKIATNITLIVMIILIEIAIRTKDFHGEFQKLSSKLIKILDLTTQAAPQ